MIESSAGTLVRMDLPQLALITKLMAGSIGPGAPFRVSLLSPTGAGSVMWPDDWWLDVLIEKR